MPQKTYQLFRVIGTLAITGNDANPGVGQSINYSFDLYYDAGNNRPTVVGTPVVTAFGPLGDFELGNVSLSEKEGFVQFTSFNPDGTTYAEIDFLFDHVAAPPPPVLDHAYPWLWTCNAKSDGFCAWFHPASDPTGMVLGSALAKVYEFSTPHRPVPYTPTNGHRAP